MPSFLCGRAWTVCRKVIRLVTTGTMDFAVQPPPAETDSRQTTGEHPDTTGSIDGMPVRNRVKMARVSSWLADCAQSRAAPGPGPGGDEPHSRRRQHPRQWKQQDQPAEHECDWETEELLLRVLVARPRFQKIPTAEEVRLFARQLRTYHSRLWTLDQTRGYFRAATTRRPEPTRLDPDCHCALPEYPEDIDDVDEMGGRWETEDQEDVPEHYDDHDNDSGSESSVATPRGPIVVRKISPVEEELRDEMIRGYWILRRKKANMRLRTASITRDFCQKAEALPCRPHNTAY